jgi:ABC-type nickel/cobalt efflux system permease component RcnA
MLMENSLALLRMGFQTQKELIAWRRCTSPMSTVTGHNLFSGSRLKTRQTHTKKHKHTNTHINTNTCTHTHTHTHIHTYIHTYIRTYTHKHTNKQTMNLKSILTSITSCQLLFVLCIASCQLWFLIMLYCVLSIPVAYNWAWITYCTSDHCIFSGSTVWTERMENS